MKQIVDEQGNVVQGLYRDDNGAIVVKDPAAMHKYKMQRNVFMTQTNKISDLEMKMRELSTLVDRLIKERT